MLIDYNRQDFITNGIRLRPYPWTLRLADPYSTKKGIERCGNVCRYWWQDVNDFSIHATRAADFQCRKQKDEDTRPRAQQESFFTY
jgi:hypothetical protein